MGGRSMPRLVPLAFAWEKPKKNIRTGMTSTPPPMPTMPLIVPMATPTSRRAKAVDIVMRNDTPAQRRASCRGYFAGLGFAGVLGLGVPLVSAGRVATLGVASFLPV